MAIEFAVATPAFLDLTFVGLESLPSLGEERFAGDVLRSPGGGGIIAVAGARLGLRTALAAPIGDDPPGAFLQEELRREGVELVGRRSRSTPTTVVLPVGSERAMVTVDHGFRCAPADVAALEPKAVAASLDQLSCVPDGSAGYITCGDDDARAFARRPPADLSRARGLFLSRREARALTGLEDIEEALERLSGMVGTVVITCGDQGLIAIVDGERYEVPAIDPGRPVVDATGARDLLVAAYVWADLRGLEAEDRLRWATVYAGLSITTPTAVGGAVTEKRLREEAARRGLTLPGG